MEDLILAQVRGLLILANAHRHSANIRLYFYYLNRANNLLKEVEASREWENNEQRAA